LVLTSSLGLLASSSGTVAVLLSLVVAADAGDMMITAWISFGMGIFQSGVRHKHPAKPFAHHPKETGPTAA